MIEISNNGVLNNLNSMSIHHFHLDFLTIQASLNVDFDHNYATLLPSVNFHFIDVIFLKSPSYFCSINFSL